MQSNEDIHKELANKLARRIGIMALSRDNFLLCSVRVTPCEAGFDTLRFFEGKPFLISSLRLSTIHISSTSSCFDRARGLLSFDNRGKGSIVIN